MKNIKTLSQLKKNKSINNANCVYMKLIHTIFFLNIHNIFMAVALLDILLILYVCTQICITFFYEHEIICIRLFPQ